MTTQTQALLAPVVIYERLRTAQKHRDPRVHTDNARRPRHPAADRVRRSRRDQLAMSLAGVPTKPGTPTPSLPR
jgi:hypothetical protein